MRDGGRGGLEKEHGPVFNATSSSRADTDLLKSHFLFAKGFFCTRGFFMTHSPWVAARRLCQNSRGTTSGHQQRPCGEVAGWTLSTGAQ